MAALVCKQISFNSFKNEITGWNDKIVALEKTPIPFPLNENLFSFLVADHLLVG